LWPMKVVRPRPSGPEPSLILFYFFFKKKA
jgi:hypothetical protein